MNRKQLIVVWILVTVLIGSISLGLLEYKNFTFRRDHKKALRFSSSTRAEEIILRKKYNDILLIKYGAIIFLTLSINGLLIYTLWDKKK